MPPRSAKPISAGLGMILSAPGSPTNAATTAAMHIDSASQAVAIHRSADSRRDAIWYPRYRGQYGKQHARQIEIGVDKGEQQRITPANATHSESLARRDPNTATVSGPAKAMATVMPSGMYWIAA
ncbi:MAG: hypothetical protein U0528_18180 [Anaerolineae bacterium]